MGLPQTAGDAGDTSYRRARFGEERPELSKSCVGGVKIPGDPRHPRHPEADGPSWDHLDDWRSRLNRAAGQEARRAVATAWVRAVPGAWVNGKSFKLPHDLPRGLALNEMRDFVKRCGFTEVN